MFQTAFDQGKLILTSHRFIWRDHKDQVWQRSHSCRDIKEPRLKEGFNNLCLHFNICLSHISLNGYITVSHVWFCSTVSALCDVRWSWASCALWRTTIDFHEKVDTRLWKLVFVFEARFSCRQIHVYLHHTFTWRLCGWPGVCGRLYVAHVLYMHSWMHLCPICFQPKDCLVFELGPSRSVRPCQQQQVCLHSLLISGRRQRPGRLRFMSLSRCSVYMYLKSVNEHYHQCQTNT